MMRRHQKSKSIDSADATVEVSPIDDEYTRRAKLKFGERSRGQGKLFEDAADCQNYFLNKTSNSASQRNLASAVTASQHLNIQE